MQSDLFSIFGFTIQRYGLMLALGFIMCYFLSKRLARQTGRNENQIDFLLMTAIIGGVFGARLVYVIQFWGPQFTQSPAQIFAFWSGGLVFYGGFLLAALLILIYAWMRRREESPLRLLDFCVVFVPLGHAFGRLGCFMHGCCFGGRCSADNLFAVRFPKNSPAWTQHVRECGLPASSEFSFPVWSTQLMEAMGLFALFGLLWWLYRCQRTRPGLLVAIYCMAYSILRFIIEMLRDDPRGGVHFSLTFSQLVSLGLFGFGLAVLGYVLVKGSHNGTIESK
ncbi:MAG: prolipoprotein diacylglyceryl transferase [bacterium]|nr:prolipoprotein diacylglyceryl transferase [bacterium]